MTGEHQGPDRRHGWVQANGSTGAVVQRGVIWLVCLLLTGLMTTGIGAVSYVFVEQSKLAAHDAKQDEAIDRNQERTERNRTLIDDKLELRDERLKMTAELTAANGRQISQLADTMGTLQISVAELTQLVRFRLGKNERPTIGATPQGSQ